MREPSPAHRRPPASSPVGRPPLTQTSPGGCRGASHNPAPGHPSFVAQLQGLPRPQAAPPPGHGLPLQTGQQPAGEVEATGPGPGCAQTPLGSCRRPSRDPAGTWGLSRCVFTATTFRYMDSTLQPAKRRCKTIPLLNSSWSHRGQTLLPGGGSGCRGENGSYLVPPPPAQPWGPPTVRKDEAPC